MSKGSISKKYPMPEKGIRKMRKKKKKEIKPKIINFENWSLNENSSW
jgi:hypothetical protein